MNHFCIELKLQKNILIWACEIASQNNLPISKRYADNSF